MCEILLVNVLVSVVPAQAMPEDIIHLRRLVSERQHVATCQSPKIQPFNQDSILGGCKASHAPPSSGE
jgi:hypothetical protein